MAEDKSSGQVLSENFRRAVGLPERESDAPGTNLEHGDEYVAPELHTPTGPEGGYGGDEERTMGLNQPYERRPSEDEPEIVEGPPNPPEGQAHNMSSGQWPSDTEVSPVPTDEPVEGVDETLETPEPTA